jgi:hypothetical protein
MRICWSFSSLVGEAKPRRDLSTQRRSREVGEGTGTEVRLPDEHQLRNVNPW